MAQMTDSREPPRSSYPPQDYQGYGQPPQHSPSRHEAPRDDGRSPYPPPPDPSRQGQYPPAPASYPPPQQWAGQPYPYQYPPPQHHDPHHPPPPPQQHHYPPPVNQQPPTPMQPDAYRLPPPYPHHYYPPAYQAPQAPAPRQRTAIACKYCRKRKIRCSGYDSSPDGRCQNCVRFNQTCLFHPVSSQAAFVPASAVYGPNARAPLAGQGEGAAGQNGGQPMLYGAHGQPLGPAGPNGHPQYNYPPAPQGYPPQPYGYPPPGQYAPPPIQQGQPPTQQYDPNHHAPPPAGDRSERPGLKRGPPDEDPHNENGTSMHSPHPNAKPRHSASYDGRGNSGSSFDYQGSTSPATSTMSYQSYPQPAGYTNGAQNKGNNSPPSGLTPQSANSSHNGQFDGKTPPPNAPGSAGSSQNGRSGMKVHEMLGHPQNHFSDQRIKSDNDMLNKLDRKK